jgi:hypothetical protein
MDDRELAALIQRIVAGARIPGRRRRDDLCRELWAHFEDAGGSAAERDDAVQRFGGEPLIADSFRAVYRRDYCMLYAAKVGASIAASAGAAVIIEALFNLRGVDTAVAWRLAPGFPHAAALALAVVLAIVAAREATAPPFDPRRALIAASGYAAICGAASVLLEGSGGALVTATILAALGSASAAIKTRTARLLSTFALFVVVEYGVHLLLRVSFGPARALAASAALLAVWASTVAIVTRLDRLFVETCTTV